MATTAMALSMAREALMLMPMLMPRLRLMPKHTTLCMATTLLGTMATTAMALSMARGALMPMLMLMPRLRLMPTLTTPSMATTPLGTMATTAMALSMAREALMLMPMLMPRLRLMPKLTTPSMATTPWDMLPTPTSACTARGVLMPTQMLMLTLTFMATALATTGPTMDMATTTESKGVENRNRMFCLAALNKLVFQF